MESSTPEQGYFVPEEKHRVLIVDDHPVCRRGLRQLLEGISKVEICAEAESADEALEAIKSLRPDCLLLDVSLPGLNGLELIKLALAEHPSLAILVLSMYDESLYALRALRAGAKGYVMKGAPTDSLLEAVCTVVAGGTYVSPTIRGSLVFRSTYPASELESPTDRLTDRELEVLKLLGRGHSTREMAQILCVSVKTIETHRAHIKKKLGLMHSEEVVRFAMELSSAGQN